MNPFTIFREFMYEKKHNLKRQPEIQEKPRIKITRASIAWPNAFNAEITHRGRTTYATIDSNEKLEWMVEGIVKYGHSAGFGGIYLGG